jgi:predicted RNase H-like nuclease (RuvC/YqgF family)
VRAEPREQKADLFSIFQLESPYSADELRALVDGLKAKNQDAERRLAELTAKEELIRDRLDTIAEREKALERIKTELDQKERELVAREDEVKSEEQKKTDSEEKSAKALGALFGDGDVEVLAPRLASYGSKEAARILVTLDPERAKELLDALPQARWREFAEAYTRLVADRKTGH